MELEIAKASIGVYATYYEECSQYLKESFKDTKKLSNVIEFLFSYITNLLDVQINNEMYDITKFTICYDNSKKEFIELLFDKYKELFGNLSKEELSARRKEQLLFWKDNLIEIAEYINENQFDLDYYSITNAIFISDDLSNEELQEFYDKISTSPYFKTFDYSRLLGNCPELVHKIKGIGIKYPIEKLLDAYLERKELLSTDSKELLTKYIDELLSLMNDREKQIMINKIIKYQEKHPDIGILVESQNKIDYLTIYNKILNDEPISIYDEEIVDIISLDEVKEDFYKLLDMYLTNKFTNNLELIQKLLLCLYSNRIIEEKKLKATIKFESNRKNSTKYGDYSNDEKVFFVNKDYIQADNMNTFLKALDTVRHELRHAYQRQHKIYEAKYDFNNLMMAIDYFLIDAKGKLKYYLDNYFYVSFESDARAYAYVEVCELLKNYPELLKKYKEIYKENNSKIDEYMPNAVKLSPTLRKDIESYNSIFKLLEETIRTKEILSSWKFSSKMSNIASTYLENFINLPIVKKIITIENNHIRLLTTKELEERLLNSFTEEEKEFYILVLREIRIYDIIKNEYGGLILDTEIDQFRERIRGI